jgi:hypothetical protein
MFFNFNKNLSAMDWPFIIFFSIVILALVIFLVMRNQKDERKLEDELKNDYRKPLQEEKDIENEEMLK